jgi:hypothetical protein
MAMNSLGRYDESDALLAEEIDKLGYDDSEQVAYV